MKNISNPITVIFNTDIEKTCNLFDIDFEELIMYNQDIILKKKKYYTLHYSYDFGFYIKTVKDYLPILVKSLIKKFIQKEIPFFTVGGNVGCQIRAKYKKLGIDISDECKKMNLLPPLKGDSKKLYGLWRYGIKIPSNSPYIEYKIRKLYE